MWRVVIREVKGRWQACACKRGVAGKRVYLGTHAEREAAEAAFGAFVERGVVPARGKRGPKLGQRTKARGRAWTEVQARVLPAARLGGQARRKMSAKDRGAMGGRRGVSQVKPVVEARPVSVAVATVKVDRIAMMRAIMRRIG